MPYELEIDPDRQLCIVRGIGNVTDADIDSARAEVQASSTFQAHFSEILDLTGVTDFSTTADRIREVGSSTPLYAKQSRRVIIAPSAVGFGLGRMFQMLRGDEAGEIRVFHELDAALRWLEDGAEEE